MVPHRRRVHPGDELAHRLTQAVGSRFRITVCSDDEPAAPLWNCAETPVIASADAVALPGWLVSVELTGDQTPLSFDEQYGEIVTQILTEVLPADQRWRLVYTLPYAQGRRTVSLAKANFSRVGEAWIPSSVESQMEVSDQSTKLSQRMLQGLLQVATQVFNLHPTRQQEVEFEAGLLQVINGLPPQPGDVIDADLIRLIFLKLSALENKAQRRDKPSNPVHIP